MTHPAPRLEAAVDQPFPPDKLLNLLQRRFELLVSVLRTWYRAAVMKDFSLLSYCYWKMQCLEEHVLYRTRPMILVILARA